MHVEFTCFWVINPLFLTPVGETVESSTLSQPVPVWIVDVPVKFQLLISKTVRMHVEFTFFEWLTLYSQAPWGAVESSTLPRPVPGVVDVPVKFQLLISKTVRLHVEFTFSGWLTLYFWPLWGRVETSTIPRPVSKSHRRSCEVSTLHLENCANARRIHVFLGD